MSKNKKVEARTMVQQMIDSSSHKYGRSNPETNVARHDKQFALVKKSPLRDVQNENGSPNSTRNSPLPKDKGQTLDAIKVTGIKRPSEENPINVSPHQSPNSNASNAHLVYVRRKTEVEVCKSGASDGRRIDSGHLDSMQLGHPEETIQPKPQMLKPKVSSFPFAPMPVAPFVSASGIASVPLSLGQPDTRFLSPELNYHPFAAASPLVNNQKGVKHLHWEERYHQLQNLLKKLDESDQEDYLQMLRSLSSVELSRYAVQLEKRSIQLSLEEAIEVHRIGVLNVLGKSMNNFRAPPVHQDLSEKQ